MSDRQLQNINTQESIQKWKDGLPVSLKEMAVALDVGYETVRAWRRMPGFPYGEGVVFPSDFAEWRRGRFGLQGQSR